MTNNQQSPQRSVHIHSGRSGIGRSAVENARRRETETSPWKPAPAPGDSAIRHGRLAMSAARGVAKANDAAGRDAASRRVCKHLLAFLDSGGPAQPEPMGPSLTVAARENVRVSQSEETPAQAWERCRRVGGGDGPSGDTTSSRRAGRGRAGKRAKPAGRLLRPRTPPSDRAGIPVPGAPVQISLALF